MSKIKVVDGFHPMPIGYETRNYAFSKERTKFLFDTIFNSTYSIKFGFVEDREYVIDLFFGDVGAIAMGRIYFDENPSKYKILTPNTDGKHIIELFNLNEKIKKAIKFSKLWNIDFFELINGLKINKSE